METSSPPGCLPPAGRSTSSPDQLWAPSRVGRGLALLDVCAKSALAQGTLWYNLALRQSVREEVRTVCRGSHGFLCGLPRYCRSDLAASLQADLLAALGLTRESATPVELLVQHLVNTARVVQRGLLGPERG